MALRWANAKAPHRWVRQPSRELDIDGFDDLWLSPDEVPIAEYVPQDRLQALRATLLERALGEGGGQALERDVVSEPLSAVVEEVDMHTMDIPPPVAGAGREPRQM